jgi:hypothetical protein
MPRLVEFLRGDAGVGSDGAQQRLVPGDIVEHAGEEVRRARRNPDVGGTDAGEREESLEVRGIAGEITERGDRQGRGRLLARVRVGLGRIALRAP